MTDDYMKNAIRDSVNSALEDCERLVRAILIRKPDVSLRVMDEVRNEILGLRNSDES